MAQPQVDPSVFALDWQTAHQELVRIAHHRAELDRDEARWLLVAFRGRAHQRLGFASFAQYAERTLGYKPRTTEERLRVAEALEHLPELAEALQSGRLSWTAVRELSRVATRETESDWLKAAQGRTVREVEALVSGAGQATLQRSRKTQPSGNTRFTSRSALKRLLCFARLRRSSAATRDNPSTTMLSYSWWRDRPWAGRRIPAGPTTRSL